MNHEEKKRIFDEYAQSKGYVNFTDLIDECTSMHEIEDIQNHIFTATDLVQREALKRAQTTYLDTDNASAITHDKGK